MLSPSLRFGPGSDSEVHLHAEFDEPPGKVAALPRCARSPDDLFAQLRLSRDDVTGEVEAEAFWMLSRLGCINHRTWALVKTRGGGSHSRVLSLHATGVVHVSA